MRRSRGPISPAAVAFSEGQSVQLVAYWSRSGGAHGDVPTAGDQHLGPEVGLLLHWLEPEAPRASNGRFVTVGGVRSGNAISAGIRARSLSNAQVSSAHG
jgi:hypothetical protein